MLVTAYSFKVEAVLITNGPQRALLRLRRWTTRTVHLMAQSALARTQGRFQTLETVLIDSEPTVGT